MIPHETIEIFGLYWWAGNLSTIIVIFLILYIGKINKSTHQKKIAKLLGGLSLFRWIFVQIYSVYTETWVIESSLPLQMCSFSSLFCGNNWLPNLI